jgi:hypothetical protein
VVLGLREDSIAFKLPRIVFRLLRVRKSGKLRFNLHCCTYDSNFATAQVFSHDRHTHDTGLPVVFRITKVLQYLLPPSIEYTKGTRSCHGSANVPEDHNSLQVGLA